MNLIFNFAVKQLYVAKDVFNIRLQKDCVEPTENICRLRSSRAVQHFTKCRLQGAGHGHVGQSNGFADQIRAAK